MYGIEDLPKSFTCEIEPAPSFVQLEKRNCDFKIRNFPKWEYYRNYNDSVSVINAPELINFFSNLVKDKYSEIDGIDSKLFVYQDYGHCIPKNKIEILNYYVNKLDDKINCFLFLENVIISLCEKYIIILIAECGNTAYKIEKEKLFQRHIQEYNIIFKPKNVEWKENSNPQIFEDLIYDLLKKNKRIKHLKHVSHTNERDGGRDMIADWIIADENPSENRPVYSKKRVIIQCKAYKNGVGKQDVLDIRDTVDRYDSQGYFLVVSTYTKATLTEHLDKIKQSGKIWIDWWTRKDIDEEILKYPDIITKYQSLFTVLNIPYRE